MGRTLLIGLLAAAGYAAVYLILKARLGKALNAARLLGEVREEVNRILVELNQTTNRNITLIEDRIGRLNELLGRADKKIALLEREIEKQQLASKLYSQLSAHRPEGGAQPAEPAPEPKDRYEEVVRLARSGLSPELIGRRLGITLGEVELIISLGQRRR